jgi:hypothetical protein
MRKMFFAVLALLVMTIQAGAQTKISGKSHCAKPDPNYAIEVGDRPGHSLALNKTACNWTTPVEIEGLQSKDGMDTSTVEISGAKMTESGYDVTTMANGDKFAVRFQGTIAAGKDGTATIAGKWSFASGTGKLKGIKGSGTYKGTGMADGSGDIDVEGEYTIAAATPVPAKK